MFDWFLNVPIFNFYISYNSFYFKNCDMISIRTWGRKHFWIYPLNCKSFGHKTLPTINYFNFKTEVPIIIAASSLICSANQRSGFLYDRNLRHERVKYSHDQYSSKHFTLLEGLGPKFRLFLVYCSIATNHENHLWWACHFLLF